MSRHGCFDAELLESYLKAKKSGCNVAEADKHLAQCRRCRTLVEVAEKGQSQVLGDEIVRINKLLERALPEKVRPGQIWRFKSSALADSYPIAVVTRDPAWEKDDKVQNIMAVPANFDAHFIQTADDDIIVAEEESPLAMKFLLEYWNEQWFPFRMAENYLGDLKNSAVERLTSALANPLQNVKLSPVVIDFRELRKRSVGNILKELFAGQNLPGRTTESYDSDLITKWLERLFPVLTPAVNGLAAGRENIQSKVFNQIALQIENLILKSDIKARIRYRNGEIRLVFAEPVSLTFLDRNNEVLHTYTCSEGKITVLLSDISNWADVSGFKFTA